MREIQLAFRAQGFVAKEPERGAVEIVGACLRHDGERAACRSADLGVEAVRDHAELADGLLAEAGAGETERRVGEVDAVHHDRRLARVAGGADDGLVRDEAVAASLALHAGGKECQRLEVAIGDRQRFDLLGRDVG